MRRAQRCRRKLLAIPSGPPDQRDRSEVWKGAMHSRAGVHRGNHPEEPDVWGIVHLEVASFWSPCAV